MKDLVIKYRAGKEKIVEGIIIDERRGRYVIYLPFKDIEIWVGKNSKRIIWDK